MDAVPEKVIEQQLLAQLAAQGYEQVNIANYEELTANFRKQLARLNQAELDTQKGDVCFSDPEFEKVLNHLQQDNVYEAAKLLRDQYVLNLDNGKDVYMRFLAPKPERNIFQVMNQFKMERGVLGASLLDDVERNHCYDVTILVNGLPLVSIELKRPGVELDQALAQINRYRKQSMKGLFTYTQLFVISNGVHTKYCCNQNRLSQDAFNPIPKGQVFFWTDEDNRRIEDLGAFAQDFLARDHLVELIQKFMIIPSTHHAGDGRPTLMVMRPYQIYAVKAAQKRILQEQQNGYVFACTGSGKTLTSFKLAQLLRDESSFAGRPQIAKIIFLVDRSDLDDQTVSEYNAFERHSVDRTESTGQLVRQLQAPQAKLIVTTIQKLACALRSQELHPILAPLKEQRIVFIIDECHRSQFGKMNADIKRHFKRALYLGFTGTPIFEQNKSKDRTTADVFNAGPQLEPCLHRYMIKDAIRDHNVLPFSVEHKCTILGTDEQPYSAEELEDTGFCNAHNIDRDALYHNDERIARVARDIMEHHAQKTQQRSFTAMFAIDTIATLGRYYDQLQQLNTQRPAEEQLRIAAIFSFQANEDYDKTDQTTREQAQDLLDRCIKDYNATFGTNWSSETFDGYRNDIASRMKQTAKPQIDLLLVVNMMLTGFDAKPLNTLYLDKPLCWHGLLQAYSRTNRVYTQNKQCGQIVTYRNLKSAQDDALRLFSGDGDPNEYLVEGYDHFLEQWYEYSTQLRAVAPTPSSVDQMESEDELRAFVAAFKQLPRTLGLLMSFSQFAWQQLAARGLSQQDYHEYKSRYVDLYNQAQQQAQQQDPQSKVPLDVDYEIDLVSVDHINVAYILRLLELVRTHTKAQQEQELAELRQDIARCDNPEVRRKNDLIETFVVTIFPHLEPTFSVQTAYQQFEAAEQERALRAFADQEGLIPDIVSDAFAEYEFSGHIPEDALRAQLQAAPYHYGLIQTTQKTKTIAKFILQTAFRFKDLGE